MRMFASDRVASIMERLKWPDDEPITAKMVTRAVESAQRQIEELNFERRKNVLKYDDVMNHQRQVIYEERRKILEGEDFEEQAREMVEEVVGDAVETHCPAEVFTEEWDLDALLAGARRGLPGHDRRRPTSRPCATSPSSQARFVEEALGAYEEKERRDRLADDARARADGPAEHHRHEVARAPVRDGLPAGGHPPARVRAEGPAHRVPARGLRHVRGADGLDPGGLRPVHLPRGARPPEAQQARPQRVSDNRAAVESAVTRRPRRPGTRCRRSATRCRATRPAPAAAARSTRSATARPSEATAVTMPDRHERAHRTARSHRRAHRGREGVPLTSTASAPRRPSSSAGLRPVALGRPRPRPAADHAKLARLNAEVERFDALQRRLDDARAMDELLVERGRPEMSSRARRAVQTLEQDLEKLELAALLSGEYDDDDAVATLHAGAGGTESQDWAEMLLRMYLRWAEREGFDVEVDEIQHGDEAGIKSATFIVQRPERVRPALAPSAACTGWCGSRRSTPRSGGTPRSPPST